MERYRQEKSRISWSNVEFLKLNLFLDTEKTTVKVVWSMWLEVLMINRKKNLEIILRTFKHRTSQEEHAALRTLGISPWLSAR